MSYPPWTVRGMRQRLAEGSIDPPALAEAALAKSNSNAGHNTYLWQDREWTMAEGVRVAQTNANLDETLRGLPISVKDCFDIAGTPTSCGVKFYRDLHGVAGQDSWLVERLRALGAVITGKTHLHPLAYGITGENPEFGDCCQPADVTALTGGSSSGAAASVQEGSAVAAIGTDTGGSIRVPAALCGLAGYRATIGRGDWRGGAHLAESFDTMGWLFRDLEDGPALATVFAPPDAKVSKPFTRFAVIDESFLHDCEAEIVAELHRTANEFQSLGLDKSVLDCSWFAESFEIFAPIQASEAARIHAGNFDQFMPAIRDRLRWGASLSEAEIQSLRNRHLSFIARMDELLDRFEILLLPASPVARLETGADHSQTRNRLLRYTTPFSLAGVPVVTVPCRPGGIQVGAAREQDESLVELTAKLGARRATAANRLES